MAIDVRKFLSYFPGKQIFVSCPDKEHSPPWHYHGNIEEYGSKLKLDNDSRGIFFTVNELDAALDEGRKRTKEMLVRVRAVFIDDDVVRENFRTDFPVKPNIIVNSSPGKFHYYWLVKGTLSAEDFNEIQNTLVVEYGGDNQAKDITRFLRLPGFNHTKGEPFLVNYNVFREEPYEAITLRAAFPASTKSTTAKQSEGQGSGYISDIETLQKAYEDGHRHGPVRDFTFNLIQKGFSSDEAFSITIKMFPEIGEKHITQSIASADKKIKERTSACGSSPPEVKEKADRELDWPPGLIGELARSIYDFQRYQDRTISVMTAFALVAGVAGRRYNINDLGLSIYVTLLADTGRGKDSIAKFINRTYIECSRLNGARHIGPKGFTGQKSLMRLLKKMPCICSVITEAGFAGQSKAGDQSGLRRALLDVYTKTGQHDYSVGESYSSDENDIQTVRAPNFTMINESTPRVFIETMMAKDATAAGDYGRMFIFRISGKKPYENFNQKFSLSEKVKERLSFLIEFNGKVKGDDDPQPVIVNRPVDYEAYSRHCTDKENLFKESDRMRSAMYSRANEKRLRIIGLMCALEGVEAPTEEMIEWSKYEIEFESSSLCEYHSGVGDTLEEKAISRLGSVISKVLNNQYKGARRSVSGNLRKSGIVTWGVLQQITRRMADITELDDSADSFKPKTGLEKLLNVLVDIGYLEIVSSDEVNRIGSMRQSKVGYSITDEFSLALRSSMDRVN